MVTVVDRKAGLARNGLNARSRGAPGAKAGSRAGQAGQRRIRRERGAEEAAWPAGATSWVTCACWPSSPPWSLGAAIWRPGAPLGALTALLFALFFALVASPTAGRPAPGAGPRGPRRSTRSPWPAWTRWEDMPPASHRSCVPSTPRLRPRPLWARLPAAPLAGPRHEEGPGDRGRLAGAPRPPPPAVAERQVAVAELPPPRLPPAAVPPRGPPRRAPPARRL